VKILEDIVAHDLERPWGRMHWWERPGDGPTALFLHGSCCESTDFSAMVCALPGDFHAVLMDFRGHGLSDAPDGPFTLADLAGDAAALLDEIGRRGVVLVGHSLGGMVAQKLAEDRPELAGALVLLEGWVRLDARPAGWGIEPLLLDEVAVAALEERKGDVVRRIGPKRWLRFWRTVQQFDSAEFLARTTIPVFAVWGERGLPRPRYEELAVPPSFSIQHMWVPDAGHYLPIERPKAAALAVVHAARRLARRE
jgi:pimeloyl-ACP methyl ester carboxylesterase